MEKFGQKFKDIRKSNKPSISQQKIADALGVTRQSIQRWETGDSYPERFRWKEIEEYLKLPKGWCLENIENDDIEKGRTLYIEHDQQETKAGETAESIILMTKAVIESSTVYRGALLSNIKAFYRAVQGEREMDDFKKMYLQDREEWTRKFDELLKRTNANENAVQEQKRDSQANG